MCATNLHTVFRRTRCYQTPTKLNPPLQEGPFALLRNGCWEPVAHTCNPSYLGGRDQENLGLKPAQANASQDPILKILITKKGWWSGSRCRP
jgi:hypothetical protein